MKDAGCDHWSHPASAFRLHARRQPGPGVRSCTTWTVASCGHNWSRLAEIDMLRSRPTTVPRLRVYIARSRRVHRCQRGHVAVCSERPWSIVRLPAAAPGSLVCAAYCPSLWLPCWRPPDAPSPFWRRRDTFSAHRGPSRPARSSRRLHQHRPHRTVRRPTSR